MPVVNDTELARSVREGQIARAYYFYGKDIATLEAYTQKLVSRLVKPEDREFCLARFEGKSFSVSEFYDKCEMLPMFAERLVVTVNDLNAEELKGGDFEQLLACIADLPDTTTVIFYATGIDLVNGKKNLSGKNKKLCDLCAKNGFVCDFQFKTASALAKPIAMRCAKQNCTISAKSAERIATLCLYNTLLINNEVDKLCSYVNGGEITVEAIDLLVAKQLDTNAFGLAKATAQFNTKRAMQLLNELFQQQIDSIPILTAVSMAFIDLYRARLAVSSGRSAKEVCADFGYKGREFAVTNAMRDCSNVSVERLRRCISILSQTDVELKSTRTDKRLLLEKAIVKMLVKESN